MGNYNFNEIEKKWQARWKENRTFVAEKLSEKPKYYVLDMFPYPSGSGLHVGHPLGYIATDIVARYKRAKGFNVLHPMGFDAFGLPAEQYAIQTGMHPADTTAENTQRYWEQMEKLGFSYDPDCRLNTSDADYYKWTQWIFLQLFQYYYCNERQQAFPITELEAAFAQRGNTLTNAATSQKEIFTAEQWKAFSEQEKQDVLMNYRLAYNSFGYVNWCEALGTVLANDEVKDGKSERGGHPVERRKMPQWMLRITAYADRLLKGLDEVDFPESIKAQQQNWIGRSEGGSIRYKLHGLEGELEVFTTRPDTIFGNTYMVIAPEHEWVEMLTTPAQKDAVTTYVNHAKNRSELERQADNSKTGVFTGSYVEHPFIEGKLLPIWISDYVLIGYGTGAIMAVPAHDQRDWEFAEKFGLERIEVVEGGDTSKEAFISKDGVLKNSDFISGLKCTEAAAKVLEKLEEKGVGKRQITYRIRDVIWSRQRYWGEPTPLKIKDGIYYPVSESELPVILPAMQDFKPTGKPESPLVRATDWMNMEDGFVRETNTMPGAAGSSWYFLRYFDRDNQISLASPDKIKYWMPVDLYLGGAEHAVGHLLYSRFWTKFLKDMGIVSVEEPYKKLVNQGMILGTSQLAYRHKETNIYRSIDTISEAEKGNYSPIYANVYFVKNNSLDIEKFKAFQNEPEAQFELNEQGEFKTEPLVEKMSKRLFNTVNPDDMCNDYGTDTFRMYEMFLGPLEMSKPWSTDGIEGVAKFLRRVYNLFVDDNDKLIVKDEAASPEELKLLHQLIKKVGEDIERLSFNTCIPAFMIFQKEMAAIKCQKREILQAFLSILAPFAPHLCEELHEMLGGTGSVLDVPFPIFNPTYLEQDSFEYPVQINGKTRGKIIIPNDTAQAKIEEMLREDPEMSKWLEGKPFKKVIVVPKRIINVVI